MKRFVPVALAVALAAVVWFAGTWSTTGAREADFERLAELQRSAPLLGAWGAFAAHQRLLALCVALVQLSCCAGIAYFAWRSTRSPELALLAGLLTVASPFPERWFARPSGAADGVAALALLASFGAVVDDDDAWSARARTAVASAAAFVAVLVSGWAWIPLLVLAALLRGRTAMLLGGAVLAALGARTALGIPPADLLGHWSWFGPDALAGLRLLVATALAAPALVFAFTRPRWNLRARLTRREWALVVAAAALVLCGGFLAGAPAALFAGQLALTLAAISVAARANVALSMRNAAIGGVALLALGLPIRPPAFPADDVAALARDRVAVRAAAPAFALVDHGDPALRAQYSREHLAFLAGRPVAVRYLERAPNEVTEPVLDALPAGLARIDEELRTLAALQRLRGRARFDVMSVSERGILNSRAPQATPSGLGVVPRLREPGPAGPLDAIVVVSGFSDTFENVRVQPGDRLVYLVAKALPIGGNARGTVVVEVPGRPPLAASDELPPAPGIGSLRWVLREVPLPVRAPATVRLRFEASSPGRNIGDWVAFASPAVVGR